VDAASEAKERALDRIRQANEPERNLIGDQLREQAKRAAASWAEIDNAFASPPGPGLPE
jgi:hypothetical protein